MCVCVCPRDTHTHTDGVCLCVCVCFWLPGRQLVECPLSWQAEDMVLEIKAAFEQGLQYVSWMDEETKRAAKEKVA